MPQLADPNFSRAVVLMIEHRDAGSFGLVINHPSPIRAAELLDPPEVSWRGAGPAVVGAGGPASLERGGRGEDAAGGGAGGPVSPSTGWVLHEPVGVAQAGIGGTIAI